jgi:UTP:GlnB (protein PII) uridylyltransferase
VERVQSSVRGPWAQQSVRVAATAGTTGSGRLHARRAHWVAGPRSPARSDGHRAPTCPEDVIHVTVEMPDMLAAPPADKVRAAREEARRLDIEDDELDAHVARFTSRYVASVAPRTVARHLLMLRSPLAPGEVRSRVTPAPGERDGRRELDVVTRDSPGLFSQVSGVVSLIGGQVVSANAHTTYDGVAADTFEVVAPEGVSTSWWARFEGELVDAVAGRIALRAAVDRAARDTGSATTRDVVIDVVPEAPWSSVRVRTGDRLGLLFTITDAIAELRLDIVSAQVDTRGDMVDDVFVVRTAADRSGLDQEQVRQLGLGIRWAVARLGAMDLPEVVSDEEAVRA